MFVMLLSLFECVGNYMLYIECGVYVDFGGYFVGCVDVNCFVVVGVGFFGVFVYYYEVDVGIVG